MSEYNAKRAWAAMVGRIFTTMPRDGSLDDTVWRDRRELDDLINIIIAPGKHVCVDGATGTGKSSLVKTAISRLEMNSLSVQVSKNMRWADLCKRLVTVAAAEPDGTFDVELGFKGPIPHGKVRFGLTPRDPRTLDQIRSEVAAAWSEADVCDAMIQQRVSLCLDDFERASEELVLRVSDLLKLLTQSSDGVKAKLIIIGTDDTYARLLKANSALEDRLQELSLGTFANRTEAIGFLTAGFRAMGLHDGQVLNFL